MFYIIDTLKIEYKAHGFKVFCLPAVEFLLFVNVKFLLFVNGVRSDQILIVTSLKLQGVAKKREPPPPSKMVYLDHNGEK